MKEDIYDIPMETLNSLQCFIHQKDSFYVVGNFFVLILS